MNLAEVKFWTISDMKVSKETSTALVSLQETVGYIQTP